MLEKILMEIFKDKDLITVLVIDTIDILMSNNLNLQDQ